MTTQIQIRPPVADDMPFILSSFAASYSRSAYAAGARGEQLKAHLASLIASQAWTTRIASPMAEPTEILGWLVWQTPSVVAYGLTKRGYEGRGVFGALLNHARVDTGPDSEVEVVFCPTRGRWRCRMLFRPWMGL